jgi:hypothetical protein
MNGMEPYSVENEEISYADLSGLLCWVVSLTSWGNRSPEYPSDTAFLVDQNSLKMTTG